MLDIKFEINNFKKQIDDIDSIKIFETCQDLIIKFNTTKNQIIEKHNCLIVFYEDNRMSIQEIKDHRDHKVNIINITINVLHTIEDNIIDDMSIIL